MGEFHGTDRGEGLVPSRNIDPWPFSGRWNTFLPDARDADLRACFRIPGSLRNTTALLHQNAVAVLSIVVAQIANREIAAATVELLGSDILILDHQRDIVGVQQVFSSGKEHRANTLAAEIRIDAEVEDSSLISSDVTNDAADNPAAASGYQHLRPWPEVKNEERNQPIRLTGPKTASLKLPQFGQIAQPGMPDNDPSFRRGVSLRPPVLRPTGNDSFRHDVPRHTANPSVEGL